MISAKLVHEWCAIWGIKLNASRTKTMIVPMSRTVHLQSPQLTTGRTVLTEPDDIDILEMTFECKKTFEKHRSQRFGILRKSWRVLNDICSASWEIPSGTLSCPLEFRVQLL